MTLLKTQSDGPASRLTKGFFWLTLLLITFFCCGKVNKTASAGGTADGLPGDWTGEADYERGGWRFETP